MTDTRAWDRNTALGLCLAFLGVLAFSLTLPMTRVAIQALTAAQIAVWRALVAALLAGVILCVIRRPLPARRHGLALAMCAAGTVFGFPLFTALGLRTVTASEAAVVVGLLPLATAVCGVFVAAERPSTFFWLCACVGATLTTLFVLRQSEYRVASGHAWLLCAVGSAAIGYAYGGLASRQLGGWVVACWVLVLSAPVLLVLGFFVPPPALNTPLTSLAAFVYLSVVSQLLGFFALYKGMALAGIARASQVQLLQVFLTIGFAATVFGESLSSEVLVFAAMVAVTVALGTRARIQS